MKSKKKFDSVKMMREIRDKLSQKFQKMTFQEQRNHIEKRIGHKTKPTIRENA